MTDPTATTPRSTHDQPDDTARHHDLGTHAWVERTGGQLTAAERRSLLRPLASAHATNAAGRLSMLLRVNSGRRAPVDRRPATGPRLGPDPGRRAVARRRLSPALLNHSYRTYAFGAALGELESLDVDRELLFAAALLHDVGLPTPVPQVDFTRASARVARDVAEDVGLSTAATDTLRTAITLHHSPGVTAGARPGRVPALGRRRARRRRPAVLAAAPRPARRGRRRASPRSGSSASSPPRSAPRPPGCPAAGPRSCAATARSTWPSRLAPFRG